MILFIKFDYMDSDIEPLLKLYHDNKKYISVSANFFEYVLENDFVYLYKIFSDDKLIGTLHLEQDDEILYLSIMIDKDYHHQGYATYTLKEVLKDSFHLGYKKIVVYIDKNNLNSIKLFEKVGFKFKEEDKELLTYVYDLSFIE
ncbi:GNAT family N-acetyltransferase [Acholeplasma hippikon]|uniref:Ribosomal-protein-alanine acetyltransferase n=1 Tax=Acholeplasma hippikon TaxID=264636 RepID=A0A449BI22_9MOLU|nr:GNAT family N-acetyltransferase [Acholeplasma hippikon]VEU82104.1 ribosomal-protein-alanine acetyltransferase [Acholeplasma hippikon]